MSWYGYELGLNKISDSSNFMQIKDEILVFIVNKNTSWIQSEICFIFKSINDKTGN